MRCALLSQNNVAYGTPQGGTFWDDRGYSSDAGHRIQTRVNMQVFIASLHHQAERWTYLVVESIRKKVCKAAI